VHVPVLQAGEPALSATFFAFGQLPIAWALYRSTSLSMWSMISNHESDSTWCASTST
jgi:hypothetical protein